jgi:pimeloyl-ACP methyl ester carboxylesterase
MADSTAPNESRALVRLTFDELGGAAGGLWGFHSAVSGRVFRWVPGGRVIQRAHDGIAGSVYSGLRGGTSALGRRASNLAVRGGQAIDRPALSTTPIGSGVIAAVNGLIGDVLEREGSELHQPMSVRVGGATVAPDRDALAEAFPNAAPRLVVFVHGLMGTEFGWRLGAGPAGQTYGTRLERDIGCTPVYVRYNSGRHVSQNGRSLADLLEEVVAQWPVEVEEVALIGHSMGGLVSRSACYQAAEDHYDWVRRVRHTVSLGSPHMGAPLEQAVHFLSAGLHALPETRPVSTFLRRRSVGIRDLRRGSLVDEDWRDCDPDALRAAACKEIPLLDGATHCFVAATVTRSERHPLGRMIGDTLVLNASASGRSRARRIPFEADHGVHLGGTHHLALLNHPAVYERLRGWLFTPGQLG